ncbi:uncharacterized protein LOC106871914 [Octopus bimaculoides]|uniref:uncharacterized protein LOC106871914 n=1 Tax=Octopus bimaculoides TaxID=37653 RepID=UPI0022E365CA|nr:uncharacterized protein LOC106871914 [Octopus bimaculoides]
MFILSGTARCFFGGAVRANNLEIPIEVKPLPRVEITPNPIYVEEGKKVDVSCSITNNVNGKVYINSTKAAEGGNTAKITLDRVTKDQSIICYAVTDDQRGPIKKAVLEFIAQGAKMCSNSTDNDGNKWPQTASGKTAKILCEGDYTGMISRYCAEDKTWGDPNKEHCIRRVFIDIINKVSEILLRCYRRRSGCVVSSLLTNHMVPGSVPLGVTLGKCLILWLRADQSLVSGFGRRKLKDPSYICICVYIYIYIYIYILAEIPGVARVKENNEI